MDETRRWGVLVWFCWCWGADGLVGKGGEGYGPAQLSDIIEAMWMHVTHEVYGVVRPFFSKDYKKR